MAGAVNARGQNLFDTDDRDHKLEFLAGSWRSKPGAERHPKAELSGALADGRADDA